VSFTLKSVEEAKGGCVWLRYTARKEKSPSRFMGMYPTKDSDFSNKLQNILDEHLQDTTSKSL